MDAPLTEVKSWQQKETTLTAAQSKNEGGRERWRARWIPLHLDPLEEFHFLPLFLPLAGLSLVLGLCLVIGGLLVLTQFRGLVERVIKSVSINNATREGGGERAAKSDALNRRQLNRSMRNFRWDEAIPPRLTAAKKKLGESQHFLQLQWRLSIL